MFSSTSSRNGSLYLFVWVLFATRFTNGRYAKHVTSPDETERNRRPSLYPVEEHVFHATIDHFNFRPTTVPTFPLHYYVNEEYVGRRRGGSSDDGGNSTNDDDDGGGPTAVFVYAGNEDDVIRFVNNSGFLFEAAEELGAMVVFAEHRYYGRSLPFGDDFALGRGYNVSFLTVEQAMEDLNTLNMHVRDKWRSTKRAPFVVFGGSYGANLAMWLRLKNPNLWAGAVASSATPLKHLLRETNGFAEIETETYGNVSSACPDLVRRGWRELYAKVETPSGRVSVRNALSLCSVPEDDETAPSVVHGWISSALESMVQYGYPYPTHFVNPLPAYPYAKACAAMVESGSGLGALRAAIDVYYNHTGQAGECYDFRNDLVRESLRHWTKRGRYDLLSRYHHHASLTERGASDSRRTSRRARLRNGEGTFDDDDDDDEIGDLVTVLGDDDRTSTAWGYQTCTEVYQPMPTNGVTDFEIPSEPDRASYFAWCEKRWGVVPRPRWEEMTFMGDDVFQTGSNIFLSNGQIDPWRAAGIQSIPPCYDGTIVVRTIEGGAHHLDLRESNPLDPTSVVNVRNEEKRHISRWIKEWKHAHSSADRAHNRLAKHVIAVVHRTAP